MMRLLSFALFGVALSLMSAASPVFAEGCGCRLIPLAGGYAGADAMVLTYEQVDEFSCPTALRVSGKREGAPDFNVGLVCDPATGSFSGAEAMPFGKIGYLLTPLEAQEQDSEVSKDIFADLVRVTWQVRLDLTLPERLKQMGKKDRSTTMTRTGAGGAPACLCDPAKAALETAEANLKAAQTGGPIAVGAAPPLASLDPARCQVLPAPDLAEAEARAEQCFEAPMVEAAFKASAAQAAQCETVSAGGDMSVWLKTAENAQSLAATGIEAEVAALIDWVATYCQ